MTAQATTGGPLASLLAELDKCVRCGQCRVVCPVFAELRREKFTSRGKVSLVRAAAQGDIGLSDGFYETLDNCLLCMACVANCSTGVRTDAIVLAGRAAFVEKRGLTTAQRLVRRGLLAGPGIKGAASRLQTLFFGRLPDRSGMRARFPLPLLRADQVMPRLAATPFRDRPRQTGPDNGETVIFFTGCMANYAYTGVAEAVVAVLEALGVRVVVPRDQSCCGAAMLNMGDRATATAQARANAAVLGKALERHRGARIVVPCPTCGLALKRHHPDLLATEDTLAHAARSVAHATMDISEYLADVIGPERLARHIAAPVARRTAYHHPCHLNRGQGVTGQPLALLRMACPDGFTDMAEAERCCGMGGSYFLSNPDTSKAILERKMDCVAQSGAALVATGCPACMLQLDDGLARRDMPGRALHTVEVLAMAMGLALTGSGEKTS